MNPWLIAALALGLVAVASGSSTTAPRLAPAPTPTGGGSGSVTSITPANVNAAVAVALAHETNPHRLTDFGNALIAYGYPQGTELLAKAVSLTAPAPSPQPIAVTPTNSFAVNGQNFVADTSGVHPVGTTVVHAPNGAVVVNNSAGKQVGSLDQNGNFVPLGGGNPVGPNGELTGSEFSSSSSTKNLVDWVNQWAHTHYKNGQVPSKHDADQAVNAVIEHGSKQDMLDGVSALGGDPTYFELVEHLRDYAPAGEGAAETGMGATVEWWTGSKDFTKEQLMSAISLATDATWPHQLREHGGAGLTWEAMIQNQLDFADQLWHYQEFGQDWSTWSGVLVNAAIQEILTKTSGYANWTPQDAVNAVSGAVHGGWGNAYAQNEG